MAKRNNETTQANGGTSPADAMEQRVVAFAEQLGRIAGTFQAKAEGWLDREALTKQIASVRDSATELLEQLAGGATKGSKRDPAATAALGKTKGRSGGAAAWSTPGQGRSAREHRGQSGRQDADGKDEGQDEPATRARVAVTTSGA